MAAAEARAAWQRTANRCMVQEDAKRAPKLAYCSSSSSSKPHVDSKQDDASNASDHSPACFMHVNWNSSNSNPSLDPKWWLHLQPNYGNEKEFNHDQLNALEAELELLRTEEVSLKNVGDPPINEDNKTYTGIKKNTGLSLDPSWRVSRTCLKNDPDLKIGGLKAVTRNAKQTPLKHKDPKEYWSKDDDLMDLDPIDELLSKETFDLDSHWVGSEKTEPWWRKVDKDELASLVAQKSLDHIENCDLPPPRSTKIRRGLFCCLDKFDQGDVLSSSSDLKPRNDVRSGSPTSGFAEKGQSLYGLDKPFSYSSTKSSSTFSKDSTETRQSFESEPSKAQILEALRHSQTRAREAEEAAQQAYTEKQHILKLFFKQASHLFAYKQWLQMLQLETICLQLKNKDHFPSVLPWMPNSGKQEKQGKQKPKKRKRGPARYNIGKYAFAFAVGLGLVGAGLLLGWTMGWLLPMF